MIGLEARKDNGNLYYFSPFIFFDRSIRFCGEWRPKVLASSWLFIFLSGVHFADTVWRSFFLFFVFFYLCIFPISHLIRIVLLYFTYVARLGKIWKKKETKGELWAAEKIYMLLLLTLFVLLLVTFFVCVFVTSFITVTSLPSLMFKEKKRGRGKKWKRKRKSNLKEKGCSHGSLRSFISCVEVYWCLLFVIPHSFLPSFVVSAMFLFLKKKTSLCAFLTLVTVTVTVPNILFTVTHHQSGVFTNHKYNSSFPTMSKKMTGNKERKMKIQRRISLQES